MSVIRESFPNLNDFTITSPQEVLYNCIAWAADENNRWWWPDYDYYWPSGVPTESSLSAFVAAFRTLGYETCDSGSQEEGFQKIVIYQGNGNEVRHAARQLPNGRWTSKLGESFDIEHALPEELEGVQYGAVIQFMRREV